MMMLQKNGSRKMTPKESLSNMTFWSEPDRAPSYPRHGADRGLGMPGGQPMAIKMKWMICAVSGLAALLTTGPAFAQPALVAPTSYCVGAVAGFMTSDPAGTEAALKCAKGDIIAIPDERTRIIARLCDFDKSLAVAGGFVICVLNGGERSEKQ
jgi:hypothetical protein